MFRVPVTFYYDFDQICEKMRPYVFADFARSGAEHLVLTDALIQQIFNKPGLEDTLLREIGNAGMSFCDGHAPFGPLLDMNCPWVEKRPAMIARLKLVLEICRYMKVETVTIHLGNNHFEPAWNYSEDVHIGWMKETLSELLPVAEKLGLTICIENSWFSVNTPDVINALKAEFPTDALGICYDSGHANIMDNGRKYATGNAWRGWKAAGKDLPVWEDQALEKMLPDVVNCHLHDNSGWSDAHALPGSGCIDWKHIITLLKKAPRIKVIQSEVAPQRANVNIPELVAAFDRLAEIE